MNNIRMFLFTFSLLRSSRRTSLISFRQPSCIVWNDSFGVSPNPDRAITSSSCKISLNDGRLCGSCSQQPFHTHKKSHYVHPKNVDSLVWNVWRWWTYLSSIWPILRGTFLVLAVLIHYEQLRTRHSGDWNPCMELCPSVIPMIIHQNSKHPTICGNRFCFFSF